MARKEITIDWKKVDDLLICGCTGTEIASALGVHHDTLYDHTVKTHKKSFSDYSAEKRQKGDTLLRAAQFNKAMKGDNTLLIWLGKQRLNQSESPKETIVAKETVQKFDELMTQIAKLQDSSSALKIADNSISNETKS